MITERPVNIPQQKLGEGKKGKEWHKQNLLYWESVLFNEENSARKRNMYLNEDLYFRGKLAEEEVKRVCNPYDLDSFELPKDFKNYPIADSRVQTLLGEDLKRPFNYKIFVTNRDAVSEIEEDKKNIFMEFVSRMIQSKELNEESFNAEMMKLQEYLEYDFQDIREKSATELLRHYTLHLKLKELWHQIWLDYILYGEAIIMTDCVSNKPYIQRVDPKTIYWSPSQQNPHIDDADAVIKEEYLPIGKVIDLYYEHLSEGDIKELEKRREGIFNDREFTVGQQYVKDTTTGAMIPDDKITVYNDYETSFHKNFEGYINTRGEIRVVELRWKSLKKIGKVDSFDEDGEPIVLYVDEYYEPQEFEQVKWLWINEVREVTRIGEDIWVKYGPRKIQYRGMDNKSQCKLGYTGTYSEKALYDVMKEYQIKYSAYMYRTEQAMVKALGKIGVIDLAMIPDDWNVDMWMYYATVMGWAVVDSFKEGKVGQAQGKLAGGMANRADVINLEQGQFIQQNMFMLQHLEQQLDLVTGINLQRRGQIKADAGLGITQEAREASATVTESLFFVLDNIKGRTLENILEVAKYALRNKSESIQYITSELTSKIFIADGEMLNEAEYGLVIANAMQDVQAMQTLQRASEIALQTGEVDLIQLMDIFSTESPSVIKRKIQKSVKEKQAQKAQQAEAEQLAQQAKLKTDLTLKQMEIEEKQKDRDLKIYEINANNQTKIAVAEISALGFSEEKDLDANGVPDVMEQADMALKQQKVTNDTFIKQQQIEQKKKEHSDKQSMEEKKLSLKEKELKIKQEDSENKVKIARMNRNKYSK